MNLTKSVFRCFVSLILSFSMLLGLAPTAFAESQTKAISTQSIQYGSGTKELIKKTISELSAKGAVYTPKTDKVLETNVKQTSGLSLGAVKTSILFDLFSDYEDGKIDTARFGLNAETLKKVLNMTLEEFALDSAVDNVTIETDDNGIASSIGFEMRSSFKAGLGEISSVNNDEAVSSASGNSVGIQATSEDLWTADFNWNYRYVGDPMNQNGLIFRGGTIQTAEKDSNGFYLTKIEFYLESVSLTPKDGGDTVILAATGEPATTTEGNITTITYPNGVKVEDLFVDTAYLDGLKAELDAELAASNGEMTPDALQLIDQLNALGPCIYSHVLTAYSPEPDEVNGYDKVYSEKINATEKAVYQYYAELCDFNSAFPKHFGTAANFWTSKDSETEDGTKILGAFKTLIGKQPDTFIPFGAYDANGDGNLDLQKEIGLDFLISMLTQAFIAYEYQLGGLLDAKIAECKSQITEGMTTEQKLLAIHDWLANNAEFDMGVITAMKDGSSAGSDPSQMTAFGTLLYDALGMDGAICLGYAATYYLLLQEVMGLTPEENDIVMVRWWALIAETSVAGPDSGFGQGRFNETHYFNAVKLENGEWYYIDPAYDDIYCEVMTQYRVETDGNITHNFFLFAPTTALNMFDGDLDYIDSAYDGVTFQRRLDLDENGNVQYEDMSPLYEKDTDAEGNPHVIWYHSTYPEAAADADDATNSYLDDTIVCTETAYSDTQYEKSWFTAATGEIHNDGEYYYYVAGELESYAAMSGDDSGSYGDMEVEFDMGQIYNNDDPSFADRLVRRSMTAPVNDTQDSSAAEWSREVPIEYTMNGQTQQGTREVFVDPYTETIFHYGFGTLGQPRLDSDKTTPILGEDGSYVNDETGEPLLAEYADIVEYDAAFNDIYPDLAHTSGMDSAKNLYFNVANQIYSLSIADIADWVYTIDLLKEYNTVSYYSDGKDFGNEEGSRFTGKTFHLTSDPEQAIGTMTNKPIAAISLEDRWETPTSPNLIPTLTVSLGTSLSDTTKDSEDKSYRVEAVNYNPNYVTGYSDDTENSNAEFMWCANLVEDLRMSDIDADLTTGGEDVTVEPFCVTDGFTEKRGSNTGVSIPGTRVVDEDTCLGHDFVWNEAQGEYICSRCLAVAGEPTISYNSNGGSGTMDDTTGDIDASVTLSANTFTRDGYAFTGWNTAADGSGTAYADQATITMPAGGLTLYAQWDAGEQTISYNNNNGSGTMAGTTGDTDASVTLSANTFTRDGYTFIGWNTAADGSGTGYADGANVTMPVGGMTLYAQWDAEEQTISYNNNTGSGTMADTKGDTDASVTLSANTFTKDGFIFKGWNTAADGSGTGYADQANVTMPAGGLTLYAQWGEKTIINLELSGSNRFDTAALINKQLTNLGDTVILTTGRNFPDALSAGPLAVQLNAPILLSEVDQIPTETLEEINRLGAKKVIILGGLAAIDSTVQETLEDQGITVERISGDNRILTAIETAKSVRASSSQLEKAILVNGYEFADALSVGSYAAEAGIPILLTLSESLSPETKSAIEEFGITEIEIIGGMVAVSQAVEDELADDMGISVSRTYGSNRFATSAAVAGKHFADSQNAIIATGREYADALAAVPLAVQQDAPLLLVEQDSLPTEISDYLSGSKINNITIVGGEVAVSSTVRNQISDLFK